MRRVLCGGSRAELRLPLPLPFVQSIHCMCLRSGLRSIFGVRFRTEGLTPICTDYTDLEVLPSPYFLCKVFIADTLSLDIRFTSLKRKAPVAVRRGFL